MENLKNDNQIFLQQLDRVSLLKQVLLERYLFGLTHYDIMYKFSNDKKYLYEKIEYIKNYKNEWI